VATPSPRRALGIEGRHRPERGRPFREDAGRR
jgi:hypothetical protein